MWSVPLYYDVGYCEKMLFSWASDMLFNKCDKIWIWRLIIWVKKGLAQIWKDRNWCWYNTDFSGSVPVLLLKPRFLRCHSTGSGTSILVPASRYQGFGTRFSGGFLHLSHFGTGFGSISVPSQLRIWWNPKLLYRNINWLEPKLLKIFSTTIQKLRFLRYFRFYTNTQNFYQSGVYKRTLRCMFNNATTKVSLRNFKW